MVDSIDPKAFGAFVGRKREERGLSQTAFAAAVDISRPYLSQIESGTRIPSEGVISKILIMLGSPMDEFVKEVLSAVLTEEQSQAAISLFQPMLWLADHLSPEDLVEFQQGIANLEQMGANLQKLAATEKVPTQLAGPDGWLELNKEDRRLVQRIVNRIRQAR